MQQRSADVGFTFRRACQEGDFAVVRDLVGRGCDLESASGDGCTGMWLAAEMGRADVVAFLCSRGANTDVAKLPGHATALFVAAQNGHAAVAQALLQFGADPNRSRDTGATPIFIAAQQGHLELVQLLLDAGAQPATPNHQGLSPIMVAAYQGHMNCVELLLEAGCNPYEAAMGRNAMDWAEAGGHGKEMAKAVMLRESPRARAVVHDNTIPWSGVGVNGDGIDVLKGQRDRNEHYHSRPSRSEAGDTGNIPQKPAVSAKRLYEPHYLLRGQRSVRSSSAAPRSTAGQVEQSRRGRSQVSLASTRGRASSRVSVGRLRQLIERESRENEFFKAMQRTRFQTCNSLKILEKLQPINVEETHMRWDIWKRTLYERVRQMERSCHAPGGDMFNNTDDMF